MDRPPVRRSRYQGPRSTSVLYYVGAAIILAFAILGVVSAGNFVGGKMSSSSTTPTATPTRPGSSRVAIQDVTRAQAQATAIVLQAQRRAKSLLRSSRASARRNAAHILASARNQAKNISGGAGSGAQPSTSSGGASPTGTAPSQSGATSGGTSAGGNAGALSPSVLRTLPSNWLVVGYDVAFGSGPGTAGSISVLNRSNSTFSGVARVDYLGPRGVTSSAYASFANLAPGSAELLSLNGPPYPGDGYHIVLTQLHSPS